MKNQKQKEYEAPQTTCLEVELEQGFMKASVVDKEDSDSEVTAGNQTISEDWDFTGNEWQ
ncbi:hypothetical protein [Phocaeicola plebeius]|uniref:hypothetical protein n=1 Tax=Phocaeicola plebeius TaxID=310297 RepID=UPI0029428228|nr:hypothetical protein [Phocaeicola plebeius]